MTRIQFLDLAAQYRGMRAEIDAAIQRVLESGQFILGQEVASFEQEFARYCGVGHTLAVASGTEALQLALVAGGIKKGDEVITSAHTAVATVAGIEMAGGCPVLVDIDPLTFSLNPQNVKKAITRHTRAIVPVHLYGIPADLDAIRGIAKQHHLLVIEDCAQAFGTLYHGKQVGSRGEMGVFSFYPTKNLGAYGDGGAVVTDDPALAERVRHIRQYGWDKDRLSQEKGFNSRMDEIQAAILRTKLSVADQTLQRRQEMAALYTSLLSDSEVTLPCLPQDTSPTLHLFVVRDPRRDALQKHLSSNGIETSIHYPVPIHLQPAYADLGYRRGDFPETELACKEILSLPFYPEMTDDQVRYICQAIGRFQG